MSLATQLACLALKGAAQAAGVGVVADRAGDILLQRFRDHSTRLNKALATATGQAWRAVEVALAGRSWWDRCKLALATGDEVALRRHIDAYLAANPLDGIDGHGPDFRAQCLAQLQAARDSGLLNLASPDPAELARRVGDLSRFGDPAALVEAEFAALGEVAANLRTRGYDALATFLTLRPASGPPLLLAAARYFFQRELEKDQHLFQGLAYAHLDGLAEGQRLGFAGLEEHAERVETLLIEVRHVVARTHADVLDIKSELSRQGAQIQGLGDAVLKALANHQLERRALTSSDSLSIRDEGERRLVRDLVKRYRALPAAERDRMPALLNAVGKLEVVTGEFEAAERDFRQVVQLVPDKSARAEASHNAYLAALERRAWADALVSLKESVELDPERFAPFPAGKFEAERILGAGGFGVAILCRNRHSGGRVVIKALRRDRLDRDLGDVFQEAQALEELEHPAIIRVRDCDFADAARSRPYFVMDYFAGASLAEHVERHGHLSTDDLVSIARLVGEGLRRAHQKGILHRDVKPGNLLVRRSDAGVWEAKLIDFGLAVRAADNPSTERSAMEKTLAGSSLAGTMDYAAPEQLGKVKGVAVGPRSDVYGFGKTCCFALFGTPQPTFQHWGKIPTALAELLGRCLAEQPSERPKDFAAVLAELEQIGGAKSRREAAALAVPIEQPATPTRGVGKNPFRLMFPLLFAAALLAFGAWDVFFKRPQVKPPIAPPRPVQATPLPPVGPMPISEAEFPGVLAELKKKPAPAPARLRELAERLAITPPTDAQERSYKKLRATVDAAKSGSGPTSKVTLAALKSRDDRWQVALALEPLLKDASLTARMAGVQAMRVWGTPENVPELRQLATDKGTSQALRSAAEAAIREIERPAR